MKATVDATAERMVKVWRDGAERVAWSRYNRLWAEGREEAAGFWAAVAHALNAL